MGSGPTKLLALDFDLTLTVIQVNETTAVSDSVAIFGGKDRLDLLRSFLASLTENGVEVVVVSWNLRRFIRPALACAGLLPYISDIFDRPQVDSYSPGRGAEGKSLLMSSLLADRSVEVSDAVFVDDKSEVGLGMPCKFVCVSEIGVGRSEIWSIKSYFGLAREDGLAAAHSMWEFTGVSAACGC
mmetsp:Transcript_19991/g.44427  ORF Transcript_19991/g.44427 Transcript_19991/m.44427 type:complete len:185 (+) Transcript_19991:51-605(+)